MIVEVATMQQAIARIMADNPDISKYRLAKDLNLSTSSHINNYLTGTTTKARVEVMRSIHNKFGILIEAYKEDPEYKSSTKQIMEIKI
jgi:hypothetical protein